MSRGVFVILAFSFALAPVRAADPKPLWEIDLGPGPKPTLKPHATWVGFAKDGALAAVIGSDTATFGTRNSKLRVWDEKTRKERFAVDLGESADSQRTLPSASFIGDRILTVGKHAVLRDLATGKETETSELGIRLAPAVWVAPAARTFWALRFDPDDAGLGEHTKLVQSTPSDVPPRMGIHFPHVVDVQLPIPREGLQPRAIAFNAACDQFAIGYHDRLGEVGTARHTLAVYKVNDKLRFEPLAIVVPPHNGAMSAIAFSPDNATLATGSEDGSVCLWDMAKAGDKWEPTETIRGPDYTVAVLAFRPDGKTLAVGTWDKKKPSLLLVNVERGRVVRDRAFGRLVSLAFSPDGKSLATSAAHEGTVRVWDADELLRAR